MKADIAKKAVMACNFLVAFQQPGFVSVGKVTKRIHLLLLPSLEKVCKAVALLIQELAICTLNGERSV
jgi:hypothetical protein